MGHPIIDVLFALIFTPRWALRSRAELLARFSSAGATRNRRHLAGLMQALDSIYLACSSTSPFLSGLRHDLSASMISP